MNPIKIIKFCLGEGAFKPVLFLSGLVIVLWSLRASGNSIVPLDFILWCSVIVLSSMIIWRAGDFFTPAAEFIGEHYRMPQSVKAAVIDAVASSFPEFAVAIIAVFYLGHAEVGIATVIGSALYNVLVIPAAVGLVAVSPVLVSREVIWRDNLYYVFVVFMLLGVLWLFPSEWGIGVAIFFFVLYLGYIYLLQQHTKRHRENTANGVTETNENPVEEEEDEIEVNSPGAAWSWVGGMMLVMGGASHFLVESSIQLGEIIGVHQVIMAFVVIAAGTSVPDMVISVISARRGNYDAAISNVFGSNIFDICICLSVPVLLALALTGQNTPINLPQSWLVLMLLGATVMAFYCFWSNQYTLTKGKAKLMGVTYVAIIIASVILS